MVDIHWRNTQKPVRFFFLDARVFIALLLFILHVRLWTFIALLCVLFAFWLFEQRGLTFPAALRAFRAWILGRRRPANSRRAIRRMTDYNGE